MAAEARNYHVYYPSGIHFRVRGTFRTVVLPSNKHANPIIDPGWDEEILLLDPRARIVEEHPDEGPKPVFDGRGVSLTEESHK